MTLKEKREAKKLIKQGIEFKGFLHRQHRKNKKKRAKHVVALKKKKLEEVVERELDDDYLDYVNNEMNSLKHD